jgi:hypothetical protein
MIRKSKTHSDRDRGLQMPTLSMLVICLVLSAPAHAAFVREDVWAPNGPVRAIAESNGAIYLGGSFSSVGPVSGPAVSIDYLTAQAQTPYPRVVGKVRAVEPDGSGGWYMGGAFTKVQGQPRNNLAHIDASGNLTSWDPNVNGEVHDIALRRLDGVNVDAVFVGGSFTAVGTAPRSYLAAIDPASGVATSWACAPNGSVTEVELEPGDGGQLFIGGGFEIVNGELREHLASVNTTTGTVTSFYSIPFLDIVAMDALEFNSGRLIIAATTLSGYLLKVYDASTNFFPYTVHANGPIYDVVYDFSSGRAYFGGSFSTVSGQSRSNLASISVATGTVLAWPSSVTVDGPVRTVAMLHLTTPDGPIHGVVVGGGFSSVGGQSHKGVAVLDMDLPTVFGWNPGCGGDADAIEVGGGRIYVGGDFSTINGVARNNAAAIDVTSGTALAWDPNVNGTVNTILVNGSSVYLGGAFSRVGGVTRSLAAAVDATTASLLAFNPSVGGTEVRAFAMGGGALYIGGAFDFVRFAERFNLAAVSPTTGAPLSWAPFSNGPIYALSYLPGAEPVTSPVLVIGGQFTLVEGRANNNLALVDAGGGGTIVTNFNVNGPVYSLRAFPTPIGGYDRIYIGGAFTAVSGQSRSNVAEIIAFGLPSSWNPSANGVAHSITASSPGTTILLGGDFTNVGGSARNHAAALDPNTGLATAWNPSPDGAVHSMMKSGTAVYMGGAFRNLAGPVPGFIPGAPQSYFAVIDETITAVEAASTSLPSRLRVSPNPFAVGTMVQFALAAPEQAEAAVYDVRGRLVRRLHHGVLSAGIHQVQWNGVDEIGRTVGSGVYFVRVRTQSQHLTSKVFRLR